MGDVALRDCFDGRPRQQMNESCRKLLEGLVVERAPDKLSDHHASANVKAGACMCLLGIGLAEQMARYASSHEMSEMIRRRLGNLSARPDIKQLRADIHAV